MKKRKKMWRKEKKNKNVVKRGTKTGEKGRLEGDGD